MTSEEVRCMSMSLGLPESSGNTADGRSLSGELCKGSMLAGLLLASASCLERSFASLLDCEGLESVCFVELLDGLMMAGSLPLS